MLLKETEFTFVLENAPLVSIDLVIKNSDEKYLLGFRKNRPAQGYWFVPGGRIYKNESIDKAFTRVCKDELGLLLYRNNSRLLGAFDHFYEDCVFGEHANTHYVALAHEIIVDLSINDLPKDQHNQYSWFTRDEMLSRDDVHIHSRWYADTKN